MIKYFFAALLSVPALAAGLEGEYIREDGSVGSLAALSAQKPVVLVFSSRTCYWCTVQGKSFVSALKGLDPSNVKIITLLVGASSAQAAAYKSQHNYSWEVSIPKSTATFKSYCPNGGVPCTIVSFPGHPPRPFVEGARTASYFQSITGKWE